MCCVKSSAISLYAAGKALEVRKTSPYTLKLQHGPSLLANVSMTCSMFFRFFISRQWSAGGSRNGTTETCCCMLFPVPFCSML